MLDQAELAHELFLVADLTGVDRGLDLLHYLTHDFVVALLEGAEVALLELHAYAAALVQHARHALVVAGAQRVRPEELHRASLDFSVEVLDKHEVAGHLVCERVRDALVVQAGGLLHQELVL